MGGKRAKLPCCAVRALLWGHRGLGVQTSLPLDRQDLLDSSLPRRLLEKPPASAKTRRGLLLPRKVRVGAGLEVGRRCRGALTQGSEDAGGKGGAQCMGLPRPAPRGTAELREAHQRHCHSTSENPETPHCLWLFPLLQGPASSFRLGTATNQPWDIALAWEGPSQPSAYLILTTLR